VTVKRTWIDGRVDVLLAALDDFGMSASRTSAADLIRERVGWVAAQMRVTPATARRYLTDDALGDLARTMVVSLADEAPGADLLASARSVALPLDALGRCVAGLSEGVMLRLVESDDIADVRTNCAQLVQTLSAIGQIVADASGSRDTTDKQVIMMPPALLTRSARYLDAVANMVADDGVLPTGFDAKNAPGLTATFRNDATRLRYFAGE
jgi:hypothetical protein